MIDSKVAMIDAQPASEVHSNRENGDFDQALQSRERSAISRGRVRDGSFKVIRVDAASTLQMRC
jgi:hypothetical protein